MPGKTASQKMECLNPNTGRRMNIDKATYHLFSKAILHSLGKNEAFTFTQMVEGIRDYFKQQKIVFEGAVDWYAITVKHDLHARGIIEVFTVNGKKLHRLKK